MSRARCGAKWSSRKPPDVPVLYISGFTDDVFQRRGIQPDELDLLLEPFTHHELQARIARLLARQAATQ